MPRKYSAQYVDRLLAGAEYSDLVELSSAIRSSSSFTLEKQDYGLPRFAFIFVETLLWFAQAVRSGVWTYHEATPQARQDAMAMALREIAPVDVASMYERGMRDWRDETKIAEVGQWIRAQDNVITDWLRAMLMDNREALLSLT